MNAAEQDRRLRSALALALLQPCLLCGGRAACSALFIPNSPAEATIAHSLCRACFDRPDKAQAAEAVVYRQEAER